MTTPATPTPTSSSNSSSSRQPAHGAQPPHQDPFRFSRLPSGRFLLETSQSFPQRRDDLFPFFADAHNLEQITPPLLRFRILTKGDIPMKPGTLIDYRINLHGIPLRWRTEITAFDPPRHFQDRQLRGPYQVWEHDHWFEDHGDTTVMHDRIEYSMLLPWLVHETLVKPDLRSIFTYRRQVLEQRFGAVTPS